MTGDEKQKMRAALDACLTEGMGEIFRTLRAESLEHPEDAQASEARFRAGVERLFSNYQRGLAAIDAIDVG